MTSNSKGLVAAFGAFSIWGILPLYWKALSSAIPLEILCHRITWSTLTTLFLLFLLKKSATLKRSLKNWKIIARYTLTSLILSLNWLLYIWAVNSNFIVETSLGYYINPLINILLGVFFLQERLRPPQWVAIFIAFSGVCYLTQIYGSFPWIAITLAVTFSFYGLLRKTAPLPSLEGLCLETSIIFLPALIALLFFASQGKSDFIYQDNHVRFLLIGTGIITSLPLLLFGFAAQRIPLSTLGIVQYLGPTLQLSIGIFVFDEPFPLEQLIGFSLVWLALFIYAIEGIFVRFKRSKQLTHTSKS